jgi:adenine-specific DNA-methyltransferase
MVRYMGTKRALAPLVRRQVERLDPSGRVLDLFAGMGSVSASLAPRYPVMANDAMAFVACLARAKLTTSSRLAANDACQLLTPAFKHQRRGLSERFSRRLARERVAMQTRDSLAEWMATAPHSGASRRYASLAAYSSGRSGQDHYLLTTLYFSASYFSTAQAIEADAIRYAIDRVVEPRYRDQLLAAWLEACGSVVNAPGHAAQYLKPTSDAAFFRIRRTWERSVWEIFKRRLLDQPEGTSAWRRRNIVRNKDALELMHEEGTLRSVDLVYADPPYTKDQYSRYYHAYETLYLYDYPASTSEGRYRGDRLQTDWSRASGIAGCLEGLAKACSERGMPLILSYPSNGLLAKTGMSVRDVIQPWMRVESVVRPHHVYSTLGASKGDQAKVAEERIFVLRPALARRAL